MAALDAAIKVKSLPVMPSRTSLERPSAAKPPAPARERDLHLCTLSMLGNIGRGCGSMTGKASYKRSLLSAGTAQADGKATRTWSFSLDARTLPANNEPGSLCGKLRPFDSMMSKAPHPSCIDAPAPLRLKNRGGTAPSGLPLPDPCGWCVRARDGRIDQGRACYSTDAHANFFFPDPLRNFEAPGSDRQNRSQN